MARAKNLLSGEVIHLARVGRISGPLMLGASPGRKRAGTILADSGRPPFLPPGNLATSPTLGVAPPLAAPLALPCTRVFMKKEAMAQYSFCFQSVNGWLWH